MKLIAILFAALLLQTHASDGKPNILLILADDLGYADLSIQGCTQFQTPHIDSIAKNGIRFRQGYVSNSVCAPSRAGILSGRIGIGFESNLPEHSKDGLDPKLPTMADMLRGGAATKPIASASGIWAMNRSSIPTGADSMNSMDCSAGRVPTSRTT